MRFIVDIKNSSLILYCNLLDSVSSIKTLYWLKSALKFSTNNVWIEPAVLFSLFVRYWLILLVWGCTGVPMWDRMQLLTLIKRYYRLKADMLQYTLYLNMHVRSNMHSKAMTKKIFPWYIYTLCSSLSLSILPASVFSLYVMTFILELCICHNNLWLHHPEFE